MKEYIWRQVKKTRKIFIGFLGWAVLLAGMVMIPYPGPGWVVVFVGLSILATEFDWARSTHDYIYLRYTAWLEWVNRQPFYIRAIFWMLTFATVVITVWLVNGYGLMSDWLGLHWDWLKSPLVR